MKPTSEMTDQELNEAAAVEAMKFGIDNGCYYGNVISICHIEDWNPTCDTNHAFVVADKLYDTRGFCLSLHRAKGEPKTYCVYVSRSDESGRVIEDYMAKPTYNPARAITEACLMAVRGEK